MTKNKLWLPDVILYALLLLGGVALLLSNVHHLIIYEPRLRQPTTTGTIISATYHTAPMRDDAHVPKIEFTYTVGDRTYRKNAVEDINRVVFFNTAEVEAILANYPEGTKVPVYYVEGKPETAVFQSGIGTPFNNSRRRLIYSFWNLFLIIFVVYAAVKRSDYDHDHNAKIFASPLRRLFDIPKT